MNVQNYLRPGEQVEAQYRDTYATDQRLILSHPDGQRGETIAIDYDRITTITTETYYGLPLIINGIILLFIGQYSTAFLAGGALMLLLGILYRHTNYVVHLDGGDSLPFGHHQYIVMLWGREQRKASQLRDALPHETDPYDAPDPVALKAERAEKQDNTTELRYEDTTYTYCTSCGAPVGENDHYCSSCGTELD